MTHFGNRTVQEKALRGIFDSVAGKYDLMNDPMSMGTHRIWKTLPGAGETRRCAIESRAARRISLMAREGWGGGSMSYST